MPSEYDSTLYEKTFYDVELRIFRSFATGGYQIALRTWLDDEVSQELDPPPPDLSGTAPEGMNPRTYGEMLYKWLFRGRIGQAFERARWSTSSRSSFSNVSSEGGMRFFVALAEDLPPEIARVRWEALQAPDGYLPLSMSTAFARLIRVRARPTSALAPTPVRMLQVLANPVDLGTLGLPDLDPLLWNFTDDVVKRPWAQSVDLIRLGPSATLDQVRAGVLQGCHIVYVAAHVLSDEKETRLVLADAGGRATVVPEEPWIACLVPPDGPAPYLACLVVPAQDFSSGGQQWQRVAQRLLSGGVRFVITMQGPLEPWTLARFNQSFFTSLLRTGLVDVAVASARFDMLAPDRPDSWEWAAPVLSLRTHGASLVSPA